MLVCWPNIYIWPNDQIQWGVFALPCSPSGHPWIWHNYSIAVSNKVVIYRLYHLHQLLHFAHKNCSLSVSISQSRSENLDQPVDLDQRSNLDQPVSIRQSRLPVSISESRSANLDCQLVSINQSRSASLDQTILIASLDQAISIASLDQTISIASLDQRVSISESRLPASLDQPISIS